MNSSPLTPLTSGLQLTIHTLYLHNLLLIFFRDTQSNTRIDFVILCLSVEVLFTKESADSDWVDYFCFTYFSKKRCCLSWNCFTTRPAQSTGYSNISANLSYVQICMLVLASNWHYHEMCHITFTAHVYSEGWRDGGRVTGDKANKSVITVWVCVSQFVSVFQMCLWQIKRDSQAICGSVCGGENRYFMPKNALGFGVGKQLG